MSSGENEEILSGKSLKVDQPNQVTISCQTEDWKAIDWPSGIAIDQRPCCWISEGSMARSAMWTFAPSSGRGMVPPVSRSRAIDVIV